MPQWLVVGLDSGVHWPTTETRVRFRGHEILLRPETDKLAPNVALAYEPPMTYDEALALVRRFLSSLAWVEGGYIRETLTTGGGIPINVGKGPGARLVNPRFRVDYLPDPDDPRARLALALYREALNVNSIPYKFLGFFKIINVVHRTGPAQEAWINSTVELLEDHQARARLAVLRGEGRDVGNYLYESGRCAVAHAFNEPLVDPDDPEDTRRLTADLSLIKALAEHLIGHELGVQSQRTVWREHLYELDGFRAMLGAEIVAQLRERQDVSVEAIPGFPRLNIRLRDHDPLAAFENMAAEVLGVSGGRLLIQCTSDDQCVLAGLSLNFAEERLEFDPIQGVVLFDDGSARAVRNALDRINFIRGLYLNGQLEVWDAGRGILLGRCDPFIPVNIDLRGTMDNLDRIAQQLNTEAARRASGEA